MQEICETGIRSLGWEDILEEATATCSSILALRIPMDRGAWQATIHRVAESDIIGVTYHACTKRLAQ